MVYTVPPQATSQAVVSSGGYNVLVADVVDHQSRITTLEAAPAPASGGTTVTGSVAGEVAFDSLSGTTTDAKIASMNALFAAESGGTVAVRFSADTTYTWGTTPIVAYSGMRLLGGNGMPVHEYSRSTVLSWTGAAGTSMFTMAPGNQPGGQGSPNAVAPRDLGMVGIQFQGNSGTHWWPKNDPDATVPTNAILWWSSFQNCSWKNFSTIFWGLMDGVSIGGVTHIQGVSDTPFKVGGSENYIFAGEKTFVDSQNLTADKYLIWSKMSKSTIGQAFITGTKATPIKVSYGQGLRIVGTAADAQQGDALNKSTNGAGVLITGGRGIILDGLWLYNSMTNPANAGGGVADNTGEITIKGTAQQVIIGNCQFGRHGDGSQTVYTPDTVPAIDVQAGIGAGQVKVAYNAYVQFSATPIIHQATSGQIQMIPDTTVSLTTG